jgi:hypothetical protein
MLYQSLSIHLSITVFLPLIPPSASCKHGNSAFTCDSEIGISLLPILVLERTISIIRKYMAFKRSDNGRSMAESAILGGAAALSTSGYSATSG